MRRTVQSTRTQSNENQHVKMYVLNITPRNKRSHERTKKHDVMVTGMTRAAASLVSVTKTSVSGTARGT